MYQQNGVSRIGHVIPADLVNAGSLLGLSFLGAVFFVAATVLVVLIRRTERRLRSHLTDVTALRFVSALGQVLACLTCFVLYAHLVPELHAIGTALLTGVSVVSVVAGLAAQSTLGNLIAGLSLVLYRPVSVGDTIQIGGPSGLVTATVEAVALGFTLLRDGNGHEVVVPNSIMTGSTIIRLKRARG